MYQSINTTIEISKTQIISAKCIIHVYIYFIINNLTDSWLGSSFVMNLLLQAMITNVSIFEPCISIAEPFILSHLIFDFILIRTSISVRPFSSKMLLTQKKVME